MTHSTAHIVTQMLEAHYRKCEEGYYGGSPCGNALTLIGGGLLQDYLNENTPQGLVKEFDSALTWATPTSCRDRLLILNCAAAADILPDDEPDHLSWRGIQCREDAIESVTLTKQPGLGGFGFSLVTIDKSVYVRRLQAHSPAQTCSKVLEGDRVISICGRMVGSGFSQKDIIQLLKAESEVDVRLAHVAFDGKGCPETTLDRQSPLQSPALESSYQLALDLSHSSPGNTSSHTSPGSVNSSLEERGSFFRHNGMSSTGCDSILRGDVRAEPSARDVRAEPSARDVRAEPSARRAERLLSAGSMGDTTSTSSLEAAHSSSGSDPTTRSSPFSSRSPRSSPRYYPDQGKQCDSKCDTSSICSSSVNRDFYRDSVESLPASVQSLGSTEYIVLPNKGRGVGIGISGKSGVIIRNILPGSIAEKDGRLQIGDHILQVNNIKCSNMGQAGTKDIIIPELRNSKPTVRLVVQHASNRVKASTSAATPSKTGAGSTLPVPKHIDQAGDLLLPEAMWSDAHPTAPIAYRFGTVILPAPAWIRWSSERHFVTLARLPNGYGFSIMDYKEPKEKCEESSSVLIIRQITPFGAADIEGHLGLGERIVAVNKELVTNHTIEHIVKIIKPCSVLQLQMCKPVESESWRGLLNTNISAIPLVSGPRSGSSQDAISTSTLNVARAASYQSLVSYTHQPVIRHRGDHNTHHGDLARRHSDLARHHRNNILQEDNFHRREGSVASSITNSDTGSESALRNYDDALRRDTGVRTLRRNNSDRDSTCSRGNVSRYEKTGHYGSYKESGGTNGGTNGAHFEKQHSFPRRYQPSRRQDDSADSGTLRRANSDKSERVHRDTGVRTLQRRRYDATEQRDNRDASCEHPQQGARRSPDRRHRAPLLSPQSYETTFGTRVPPKRSLSSGSNSEIQSIISSISGMNNSELTELWRQRSSQLSRV